MYPKYYVWQDNRRINIDIDFASRCDLKNANIENGWQTDWTSEFIMNPFLQKYAAKSIDGELLGLAAYEKANHGLAVYIAYVENHPESNPTLTTVRKYTGIGKALIAYGVQLSIDMGYGGTVSFEAKTDKLLQYYTNEIGAIVLPSNNLLHGNEPISMMLADEAARTLFSSYLSGD